MTDNFDPLNILSSISLDNIGNHLNKSSKTEAGASSPDMKIDLFKFEVNSEKSSISKSCFGENFGLDHQHLFNESLFNESLFNESNKLQQKSTLSLNNTLVKHKDDRASEMVTEMIDFIDNNEKDIVQINEV